MTGKTVLITGANKSIGFETARQMGRAGYRIWLSCRDTGRGQAAADTLTDEGLDVRLLEINVADDASVAAAAARVQVQDGRLDVLINNAGIPGQSLADTSLQPLEDIRQVYETNVFGVIRVTQAFLPLLKAAAPATIIMVSSGLGSLGWTTDPDNFHSKVNILGYNSSKSALNAVTVSFAKALAPHGIRVDCADPGYTATDFNGHSGYRTVEQAGAGIAWLAQQDPAAQGGRFFFEQAQVPW
ncbi:Oxidoreductase UcpA [Brevundimonas subvibrioides]|uniref:SDR family NAD(P)-dependent oxidoreductase n=1 Tax=Brevundimonas subvibrioides TaxID=74313 RepID=UPI0032D58474